MLVVACCACSGDDPDAMRENEVSRDDAGDQARLSDGGASRDGGGTGPAPEADGGGRSEVDGGASAGGGGSDDAGAREDAGVDGAVADASADPSTAGASGAGGTGGMQPAGSGGGSGTAGEPAEPAPCSERYPGALLCEDFEQPELESWSHYARGPDGETGWAATPVHTGSGALASIKRAPGDADPIYADVLGRRTSGHVYFRAYLRISADTEIAPASSRASLLAIGEDGGALGGVSLVLWQDEVSVQINGRVVSDVKAQHAVARDRWLCVQLDFAIGSSAPVRLRIDGALVAEGQRNTLLQSHYERLWLGVNWIAPEQTSHVRVHYDDVVIGTRDIACD